MKYLLDSVVLIDHFNGIAASTTFLSEHGSHSAISVITRAEVLTGFDDRGAPLALALLNVFTALPVTAEIADLAASLRRTHRWKSPDALQAAIARHHELTLVTRNTRDFQPGGTPDVWVPYSI